MLFIYYTLTWVPTLYPLRFKGTSSVISLKHE